MYIKTSLTIAGRVALLLALVLSLAVAAGAQPVVRIGGSRSGAGGMRLLAQAFIQANPAFQVEVEPSFGSSGGIRALLAGRIDLAVSGRPPNADELAQGPLTSVEYARTPFVIAVHKDLGVTALTSSQLAALFGPGAARFPNGRRARPVLRVREAPDTERLKSFSAEVARAVDAALRRRGMLYAGTDSKAADLVEHTPGAFAGSTLALIESEGRPLTALTIDGKVPTVAHLIDGSYPYYKPLYLIARAAAGDNTRRFAAFVRSTQGRALLRANGHAPS